MLLLVWIKVDYTVVLNCTEILIVRTKTSKAESLNHINMRVNKNWAGPFHSPIQNIHSSSYYNLFIDPGSTDLTESSPSKV